MLDLFLSTIVGFLTITFVVYFIYSTVLTFVPFSENPSDYPSSFIVIKPTKFSLISRKVGYVLRAVVIVAIIMLISYFFGNKIIH